jgi:predicted DNA binding CopG/RHH family protein
MEMKKIAGTDEAWESRELGADQASAKVAGAEHAAALEDALGLQSISIRLPRQLIETYKLIASHHGIGYQPLMRDILQRFVPEGLKEVMAEQSRKAEQAGARIEELRKAA